MLTLIRITGLVRTLPYSIPVWLFYILPFWALGWYAKLPNMGVPGAVFYVTEKAPAWLKKAWSQWGGHALPTVIVVNTPTPSARLIIHESAHLDQGYALGLLVLPVYLLLLAAYGYYAHPMEVHARWKESNQ